MIPKIAEIDIHKSRENKMRITPKLLLIPYMNQNRQKIYNQETQSKRIEKNKLMTFRHFSDIWKRNTQKKRKSEMQQRNESCMMRKQS